MKTERTKNDHMVQMCKDYLLSSSEMFVATKKNELKDILMMIIGQGKGERYLKQYNTTIGKNLKLPQRELLLLNLLDTISPKADLNFLPIFEDDGIVFKYFVPNKMFYVHKQKEPFTQEIQNVMNEQILPDITRELKKSGDYFLAKYVQIGGALRHSIVTSLSSYILYIQEITKDTSEDDGKQLVVELKAIYKHYREKSKEDKLLLSGRELYQEILTILDKPQFSRFTKNNVYKSYQNMVSENFIVNTHNYRDLKKVEKVEKIKEYIEKDHTLYQITQEPYISNILMETQKTYTPLVEIYSQGDVYMKGNIDMRALLQILYQKEIDSGQLDTCFFDGIEAILFHPNILLVYKDHAVHALGINEKMKEFFYDRDLHIHKNVSNIYQDQISQKKQREFFQQMLFEVINKSIESYQGEVSWDAYKQDIAQRYRVKIINIYKDAIKKSKPHVINGESISQEARKRLEFFISTYSNIFPKYIPEINVTYGNMYRRKPINIYDRQSVMFQIKEKLEKGMIEMESELLNDLEEEKSRKEKEALEGLKHDKNKEEDMYAINLYELDIFAKHPEYRIVFVERFLGKIYKDIIYQEGTFMDIVGAQAIQSTRKYFKEHNMPKSDESIGLILFVRYSVKYLDGNYKVIPSAIKEYLDKIFLVPKEIGAHVETPE